MTLDRAIAGVFLVLCIVYGYTAFVTMEANLLPFELNMAFLPNTMPKWLSVAGAICALVVIVQSGPREAAEPGEIDYRNLGKYKLGQALLLLGAMALYAVCLFPVGFIISTTLFLAGGAAILGERKFHFLLPIAVFTAVFIWWLVQGLLGVFLRPWPSFL